MEDTEKKYIFEDTMMSEPDEEEFFDTSEKILKLSDRLAEDIILDNIVDQLHDDLDTLNQRINYVELFKEKYAEITPSDDVYDEEYMKESLVRVASTLGTRIKERYGVELADDLDYTTPAVYLDDMSVLYEFLFIRQYENLVNYIQAKLNENKEMFVKSYKNIMDNDDKHLKDLFVVQSKKKFKNEDDVIIMHFINEIISDIRSMVTSAYSLFTDITKLDFYEETNYKMYELLINYGNKIILPDDGEAARLYFKPMDDPATYSEIRNTILMNYLEGCEIDE